MAQTRLDSSQVLNKVGNTSRQLKDKLGEFVSVKDFGAVGDGVTDDTAAIQAAFSATSAGILSFVDGTYKLSATISKNITHGLNIVISSGCIIVMTSDADVFNFEVGEQGSINVTGQNGLITCELGGQSTNAAAFRIRCNGTPVNSMAVVFDGAIRIQRRTGAFKYGLHLTDCQDPRISGLFMSSSGSDGETIAIYGTTINSASVSWTLQNLDIYSCKIAVEMESTRFPGIEGVKFVDCDFVNVEHGFLYNHTSSGSPPQIELTSCHINSTDSCVKVTKAIQISITGGLFYRKTGGVGAFFEFDGCQDVHLNGCKMSIITPGVDVPAMRFNSASQMGAFVRVSGTHFWANGRTSPVFVFSGSIFRAVVGGDNFKDTTGRWLDISALTSDKALISLSEDVPVLATSDYQQTVLTDCSVTSGILDVSESLWGRVKIIGATGATTIDDISGERIGKYYYITCNTAGVTINHNSAINLRGGVPFVFGAGDTITLYREQGAFREVSRRAQ